MILTVTSGIRVILDYNAFKNAKTEEIKFFILSIVHFTVSTILSVLYSFSDSGELTPAGDLHQGECPEYHASWPNVLTFWWLGPILSTGYQRALEVKDLFLLNSRDRSNIAEEKMTAAQWRIFAKMTS